VSSGRFAPIVPKLYGPNSGEHKAVSAPGLPGVEWPHYTFGPDEYGWVIQDDGNSAGQSLKVYAICAEETVLAVPVAGTMALIGLGALLALVGIGGIGRIRRGFRVG
jgi:hypothetical protein